MKNLPISQREKRKLTKYIPEQQDVVWLDFDPSSGEEIKKRRPALVLSNRGYSELTKLVLVCPITHAKKNQLKKTGLLIPLAGISEIDGYINPLQLHTFDYQSRNISKISELDDSTFFDVIRIVRDIVD